MRPGRPVIFLPSLSCIKVEYLFPRAGSSEGFCLLILLHPNVGVPCTQIKLQLNVTTYGIILRMLKIIKVCSDFQASERKCFLVQARNEGLVMGG